MVEDRKSDSKGGIIFPKLELFCTRVDSVMRRKANRLREADGTEKVVGNGCICRLAYGMRTGSSLRCEGIRVTTTRAHEAGERVVGE